MRRILMGMVGAVLLAGCAIEGQEPIVSAFNGDSVNNIQPVFAAFTDEQLLAKANDICRRGNKKYAERVSRRELPDLQGTEYLVGGRQVPSAGWPADIHDGRRRFLWSGLTTRRDLLRRTMPCRHL